MKTLALIGICLILLGCEPPDPIVGQQDRTLVVTDSKLSKHTWFSFRDVETGFRFEKIRTGKYCSNGKKWKPGTRVLMTVVTYQGKRGRYTVLPSSEARRMCR